MPTTEISDQVFQGFQSRAVPFVDTPNTMIERLLAKAFAEDQAGAGTGAVAPETATPISQASDANYTFTRPVSFTFEGRTFPVATFKEIYLSLCRDMAARHPESFDRVLAVRGRDRSYFSVSREGMTHPQRVDGTKVYAETNFIVQNIMERCRELVSMFGHDPQSLIVEARPVGR